MLRAICLLLTLSAVALCQPQITRLKTLYTQTALVRGGQGQAVIVAPTADYGPARLLNEALQDALGTQLPVLTAADLVSPDWAVDRPRVAGHQLVAMGNINDNRLLAVLWGAGYVVADSLYPGEGGYVVRTVHDPFGNGTNVLCLNGSDEAGVTRAVRAFCGSRLTGGLQDLVLPQPILQVDFHPPALRFFPPPPDSRSSKRQPPFSGPDFFADYLRQAGLMDETGRVLSCSAGDLTKVTGAIARMAQSYFWNADERLLPLMKQVLDHNRHLLSIVPPRIEMEAASAAHVPWWDVVEELPVWTDRDRLDITNALLADALQGHEQRAAHRLVKEGAVQVVDENHGTNSALNALSAWGYFDKYYDLPDSDYWMAVVRATFAGQSASFQVLEDASGYLCYCPEHAVRHAFATSDLTYFKRGVALSQARFIARCCMNNLGLQTGFGDSPGICQPAIYEALAPVAWFHRDPELSWVVRNSMPTACGLRTYSEAIPFDLTVEPREPADWTGLSVFPLYVQTLRKGESSPTPVFDPEQSAGADWFNKIVFRESWSPEGQYLLLDGAGKFNPLDGYPNAPAGHMHDDVNTIINLTALGRMWLVDHTYSARSIKDHSGLYIARDGQVAYQVHEARLRAALECPQGALTTTVFEGFSGADWERTIIWDRGQRFVVLDRAIAREPGDYVVRCSYRGLGVPHPASTGVTLEQAGRWCAVIGDGTARMDLEAEALPSPEEWRPYYPHAEPVVQVIQQDKRARLQTGESLGFATVLRPAMAQEECRETTVRPVGPASWLLTEGDESILCGCGELPAGLGLATAYRVSRDAMWLAGVKRLGEAAAPLLTAGVPADLVWTVAQPAVLHASAPGRVTFADGTFLELAAGHHELRRLSEPLESLCDGTLTQAERLVTERSSTSEATPAAPGRAADATVDLKMPVSDAAQAQVGHETRWFAGGPQGVAAFHAAGRPLWASPQMPVQVIEVADADGDGVPEVYAGLQDGAVVALRADNGERLWQFQTKPGKAAPVGVDFIRVTDMDRGGHLEALIGATWVHCLDSRGQVRWERYLCTMRGGVSGNFSHGAVADFDGDGHDELLALFDWSYPKALVLDAAGNIVLPADYDNDKNPGINIDTPRCVLSGALLGQQAPLNFVVGGTKYALCYWGAGPFAGHMAGRKAACPTALGLGAPNGGMPTLFVATDMGAVLAYRAAGRRGDATIALGDLWSADTGEKVRCLWTGDLDADGTEEVVAGGRFGAVTILDAQTGQLRAATAATESPVVEFIPGSDGLWAVHSDGLIERVTQAR